MKPELPSKIAIYWTADGKRERGRSKDTVERELKDQKLGLGTARLKLLLIQKRMSYVRRGVSEVRGRWRQGLR